jgi:hypothetical protein
MYSRVLVLTTFALILTYGAVGAFAQNQMAPQPDQQQMQSRNRRSQRAKFRL